MNRKYGSDLLRPTAVWLFLLFSTFSLLAACGPSAQDAGQINPDNVVTAAIGDLSASATASGQIEPQRRAGLSVDTPGVVEEVRVRVGDEVAAGDVLVVLDTADLELAVTAAEQALAIKKADLAALLKPAGEYELAAAEADVAGAQARLDDLLDGPSAAEVTVSEASVREANASIYSASASARSAADSVTPADIEAAKAELVAAEYQLAQIQKITDRFSNDRIDQSLRDAQSAYDTAAAKYNRLINGANVDDVSASQADLASAIARRDGNQADLNELLRGASATDLAAARATLAQAQASLADLKEGATESQIRIATAEVTQAELDLADANEKLAQARIVAPFDGVVTAINHQVGEIASGVIVELVDNHSLELVLSVDEADIGQISLGQPAELTLISWPDQVLSSTVQAISPSAGENASGIVSYDVYLLLADSELPVRTGMTADARLITAQKTGVLLVPNAAISADRQTGKYYVNLIEGDTVEKVEVSIGLRDNRNTQITAGIEAGAQLVIDYQVPDSLSNGGGGPFGGG